MNTDEKVHTYTKDFGKFVRSLRAARGFTQEGLAERAGVAADTIRRLEHSSFSPSLDTLTKVTLGLGIELSTLFVAYELADRRIERAVLSVLEKLGEGELEVVMELLRVLLTFLERTKPRGDERGR